GEVVLEETLVDRATNKEEVTDVGIAVDVNNHGSSRVVGAKAGAEICKVDARLPRNVAVDHEQIGCGRGGCAEKRIDIEEAVARSTREDECRVAGRRHPRFIAGISVLHRKGA